MQYQFQDFFFLTNEFNPNAKCNRCYNTLVYSRYRGQNFIIKKERQTPKHLTTFHYCISCKRPDQKHLDIFVETLHKLLEVRH